jgi:hypothetical protein
MEEPTNQDQSELFKNIAIATVVSINDVKGPPVVEGIASPQSSLQEPVVATAVGSVAGNGASIATPVNIPEPVHNIEEAIAIAVVRSSQNESEETSTINPSQQNGNRNQNASADTVAHNRNASATKNCEIENFIKNDADEIEKYITSELISFLGSKNIDIVNKKNGETEKINIGPCNIINENSSMRKNKELNKTLDDVKIYLSSIYEL